jgi:hypothetical protein
MEENEAEVGEGHSAWVSDEELTALQDEARTFGKGGPNGEGETTKQMLRRLMEENSPAAALSLIKLSRNARSETTRYQAARYVIERVMGPVSAEGAGGTGGPEKGTLEHTLQQIEDGIKKEHGDG